MRFRWRRESDEEIKQRELRIQRYAPITEEENTVIDVSMPKSVTQNMRLMRHQVVTYCEQMLDIIKEIEDTRGEYEMVSDALKDIQILEELSKDEKKPLEEAANHIIQLNKTRKTFSNRDRLITEADFTRIQAEEDQIPTIIKRLQSNEEYLDTVKKDMHYLEGEKMEWDIVRQECMKEKVMLQRLSQVLLVITGCAVVTLLVLRFMLQMDTLLLMLLCLVAAASLGTYILLKYQGCLKEIRQCEANKNRAITLENHVKIKYVNVKNAVDYTCEKYHVTNSREFVFKYEKYQEAIRERDRYQQMGEDLSYYEKQLVRLLKERWIKDAHSWLLHVEAFVDRKELSNMKMDYEVRYRKLRKRLEYNLDAIRHMKENVERNLDAMGDNKEQVSEILEKIDSLCLDIL